MSPEFQGSCQTMCPRLMNLFFQNIYIFGSVHVNNLTLYIITAISL